MFVFFFHTCTVGDVCAVCGFSLLHAEIKGEKKALSKLKSGFTVSAEFDSTVRRGKKTQIIHMRDLVI